jgi:LacI family transcriptional regulator
MARQGLITFRMTEKEAAAWKRHGIAVVNISSEGGSHGFPRVIPDNDEVGRRAAEHLASLGLRDFAYVGRAASQYNVASWIPGPRRYARERCKGFSAALAKTRPERAAIFSSHRTPCGKTPRGKSSSGKCPHFSTRCRSPAVFFVADDPLAVAVRHAGAACGRRVPDDLPILGFGNDHVYCHGTTPRSRALIIPDARSASAPRASSTPSSPAPRRPKRRRHVPVGLVVARESTDFLAFDDPEVARLVRWIRLNALADPVQVSDVKAQSNLSMTVLKARFQAALGHGPKREIMETRLRHLQYLLQTTDLPLEKIATSMRFPSVESMSRFLLRETGQRCTR